MDILVVARQMLVLFGMMLTGYLIFHLKWMEQDMVARLSGLVVNLFNPFLTISSVFGKTYASTGNLFWENLLLVVLFYGILFVAGFVLVAIIRPAKSESPVYRLMTLLPNCGFMGIPVVSSLLGRQYIIYVAIYMLAYNIILYTYGISLVKKSRENPTLPRNSFADSRSAKVELSYTVKKSDTDKSPQKAKKGLLQQLRPLFLNSGVIASVIALVFFFGGFRVPEGVESFCSYMGNPCIPMSMILIGCSLAAANLTSMLKNTRLYGFLLIKMLIVPISCTLLVRLLPFDSAIQTLFVLMLSMPAGSMVVLVTEEYSGKTECAASGVALSTLASIVTIPVVSLFL